MVYQVHVVVQQPQYVDDMGAAHAKHDEVPAFTSVTGDVQGVNTGTEVIALFDAGDVGAIAQRRYRQGDGFCIDFCLTCPKLPDCPADYLGAVLPRSPCLPNFPRHDRHAVSSICDASAMIAAASRRKSSAKASALSNSVYRPASMSSIPSCIAARNAFSLAAFSASRCSTKRKPSRSTSLAFWYLPAATIRSMKAAWWSVITTLRVGMDLILRNDWQIMPFRLCPVKIEGDAR